MRCMKYFKTEKDAKAFARKLKAKGYVVTVHKFTEKERELFKEEGYTYNVFWNIIGTQEI